MRPEKIQLANDIANLIVGAQFVYFISYKGLKNKELNAFRDKLFEAGAVCHVLKNRMIRKVAELNGLEALANTKLTGDTAVVVGQGDASAVCDCSEVRILRGRHVDGCRSQGDCRPAFEGSAACAAAWTPGRGADRTGPCAQCQGFKHRQRHKRVQKQA